METASLPPGVAKVKFGPFVLDLRTGELTRVGHRVRLQRQAFQVLSMLLEQPGEVVARDALRLRLWSDDTYVDFDQGLNNAMKRLRESLGDSADQPQYIETLPRLGYRFIGDVKVVVTTARASGAASTAFREEPAKTANPLDEPGAGDSLAPLGGSGPGDPRSELRVHARGWSVRVGVALALVVAVALATAFFATRMRVAVASDRDIHSIAVLPFANLSGDRSQDYFADAMTEEMTTDLAKISALRVISRTSAMHYKGTTRTMPEIARELNVDGVIEGSVLRTGDRVRITAQLINARSDMHLWSDSYERDLKDVLTLQSELAHTIAAEVRTTISSAEEERLHAGPVNPQAYEAYLRGRSYVDLWTAESSAEALHLFERATELDSNYALAYVGMAECYVYGVAGVSEEEGTRRGLAAINRALELKPDMGEAHAILGFLRWEHDWDFAGAEVEIRKGLELAPNYAPGHHWYSHFLMSAGRYDEAMVESKKLLELDPVSSTPVGHLGFQYRVMRQWDLAIEQYKKALAMDPTQVDLHAELGEVYVGKHIYPQAIVELSRAVEMARLGENYPHYLAMLGYARAQAGDIAGARKILAQLPANDPVSLAYVYAGLGDRNKSIALLNEASRKHNGYLLEDGYAVELDPLRSDPRFGDLLHRVGVR